MSPVKMKGDGKMILYARDDNGNFVPIPAICGESAYEMAVRGGYQGTEADFIAFLNGNISGVMPTGLEPNHTDDKNNPHNVTAKQVGALPIDGGIMKGAIAWDNGLSEMVGQTDGNIVIRNHKRSEDGNEDAFAFHNLLPLSNALMFYRNNVPYAVYGEHNKPKANDVGAVSTTIGESKSTLKIDIGNHIYVRDKYDADVPDMGVISNFTHYITIDENSKVTAVMSIPIDYTNKAYYYTRNDKKWHEICDAKPASGTYVGDGKTAERQIQIGGAGKVLLVTSERGMAFVQEFSGRGWGNTSTSISLIAPDKANFVNGVLTLKTESAYLNDTDITYYYTVL